MPRQRALVASGAVLVLLLFLVEGAERATLLAAPAASGVRIVLALATLALLFGALAGRPGTAPGAEARSAKKDSGVALLDATDDCLAVVGIDGSGTIRKWSRGAETTFGYRAADVVGKPVFGIAVPPSEEMDLLTEVTQILETGRAHAMRRVTRLDRKGRPLVALLKPFPLPEAEGPGEVGLLYLDPRTSVDLAEKREELFDAAPAGLIRLDAEGRIEVVNRRVLEWTGRKAEAFEGSEIARSEVFPEGARERIADLAKAKSGGAIVEETLSLLVADGGARPFVAFVSSRPSGGAFVVLVDGSSRRKIETELEARRAALASARATAADAIASTTRDITSAVKELVATAERAGDERTGPIERAAITAGLLESGKRLLLKITEEPAGADDARPPRVLLVDDNDENRDLIAHMFRLRGADVRAMGTGREAVEAAARFAYDFVLLDVQMPEMDGFEVVRRLRSLPGGDALSVVGLTAFASETVKERCEAEGMNDVVAKPLTLAQVSELLSRWGRKGPGAAASTS